MTRDDAARAALFLDFDNVFSHLVQQDVEAAAAFVRDPLRWIEWLERGGDRAAEAEAPPPPPRQQQQARRRILIRRCYLNPHAYALVPGEEKPRYYSAFRYAFVRAGFQVVDCPPLTRSGKTSADMVMVMDILDVLAHPTRFDEFIVLSSDADFTPVLLRLRAHDRRTTLVALGVAAEACRAAADTVVDFEAFVSGALGLPPGRHAAPEVPAAERDELRAAILGELAALLAAAPERVPLARAAQVVQQRLGPRVLESRWAGAGSLRRLLGEAADPRIALDPAPPGWIYDPARHTPGAGGAEAAARALSGLVRRLYRELGTIPTVLEPQLGFVFDALARRLPIADPTRVAIRQEISDEARAAGLFVSPGAVNAVIHRAGLGGFDWRSSGGPAEDAEAPLRLRRAFRDNILAQARRQGVALAPEEVALLDFWTGLAPAPDEAEDEAARTAAAAAEAPEGEGVPASPLPPEDFGPIENPPGAEAEATGAGSEWGAPPAAAAGQPA